MTNSFDEFGQEFQEKFIQALITDSNFAENMVDVFKSEYIEVKHLQFLADRYFVYAKKYRVFPSLRLLVSIVKDELRSSTDIILRDKVVKFIKKIKDNPDPQDLPWVKEKSLDFCKKQALREALEQSVDLIATDKYESIIEVIKKAVFVGTSPSIGHNLLEDIESRFERITRDCVPTGIIQLDKSGIFNGGVSNGELAVVIAGTGVGKCVHEDVFITIYDSKTQKPEKLRIGDFFRRLNFSKQSKPSDDSGDSILDASKFGIKVLSQSGFNNIEAVRWTKEEEYVELCCKSKDSYFKLDCSPDHIVFAAQSSFRNNELFHWIKVRDLRRGDLVVSYSGFLSVDSIKYTKKTDRLCDLQVENSHSYYTNEILSHNSHYLVQMGCAAFKLGLNVVHYTMELDEAKVGIRYDSNLYEMDSDEIVLKQKEIEKFYNENGSKFGRLIIKYFPTNYASTFTIKSHLDRLNVMGFIPDLIIVDYADVMRSTRKFDSLRHELRQVYEDLRQLGGELKVPIWTACFHGDTVIECPFGNQKIKDLVGKKNFPVYSYNHETDKVEIKTVLDVYLSNESAKTLKLTLDNGETIIATPNHKFMKRDGEYIEMKDLSPGDSLMPLRKCFDDKGWESIKQNDGQLTRVSDMLDEWRLDREIIVDSTCIIESAKRRSTAKQREINTKFGSRDERIALHMKIATECRSRDEFTEKTRGIPLSTATKVKIWNENNHKVVSIEPHEVSAVYNMEVDDLHNYALASGVIVKNSQSNKEGVNADIIDVTNMAEAYGKAMTADIVISISRKSQEKSLGTGRLFVAKNRAGRDGLLYPVTIDTAQSRFTLGSDTISTDNIRESDEKEVKNRVRKKWRQAIQEGKLSLSSAHREETEVESENKSEDHSSDEENKS